MRRMIAACIAVAAAAVVLTACGEDAEPAAPAAEVKYAAIEAPAPPTATDTPAPPPAPTPQPTPTIRCPQPPAPARTAAVGFSLPSAQGPQYTLNSFAGQQPVVVVFYRAFW